MAEASWVDQACAPSACRPEGASSGRQRMQGRKPAASACEASAKKTAVLLLGGTYLADRAAVDAGAGHAGEEAPVKPRIACLEGQVLACVGVAVGGRGAVHGTDDTEPGVRHAPFSDMWLRQKWGGGRLQCAATGTGIRTGRYKDFLVQLAPRIFKAYDIRGVVPQTLNEEFARGLGRAFGTVAMARGETTVAVGRDGRLSGLALVAALVHGLQEAGVAVIDVGMVTTPACCISRPHTVCSSGIQVTGSHNPRDDNGFKMVLAGQAIYGDAIQALRMCMEQEAWVLQPGGLLPQRGLAGRLHGTHCGRCASGAPLENCGGQRQRCGRGLGARYLARPGLRGAGAVQHGGWQFSKSPPRPESTREPA